MITAGVAKLAKLAGDGLWKKTKDVPGGVKGRSDHLSQFISLKTFKFQMLKWVNRRGTM